MEDIKKMRRIKDHIAYAIRSDEVSPFIPVFIIREDAEMLVRWLDNKILFEQTYGKEGTP